MPPRPPTSPPTRPPSPTNSPTTSQQPGACACDEHTIQDSNCLNCANDPYGCLGCKACGVEDCRWRFTSPFFSGFVASGNTLKSPVEEMSIYVFSNTTVSPQIVLGHILQPVAFIAAHTVHLPTEPTLPLPSPPMVNSRASGDGRRHRHHDRSPPVR